MSTELQDGTAMNGRTGLPAAKIIRDHLPCASDEQPLGCSAGCTGPWSPEHVAEMLDAAGYGSMHRAWNEGRDAVGLAMLRPLDVHGFRSMPGNPYPEAAE